MGCNSSKEKCATATAIAATKTICEDSSGVPDFATKKATIGDRSVPSVEEVIHCGVRKFKVEYEGEVLYIKPQRKVDIEEIGFPSYIS